MLVVPFKCLSYSRFLLLIFTLSFDLQEAECEAHNQPSVPGQCGQSCCERALRPGPGAPGLPGSVCHLHAELQQLPRTLWPHRAASARLQPPVLRCMYYICTELLLGKRAGGAPAVMCPVLVPQFRKDVEMRCLSTSREGR